MTVDTTWPVHKLKAAARHQDDLGKAAKALLDSPAMQFRAQAQKDTDIRSDEVIIKIDDHTLRISHKGGERWLQSILRQALRDAEDVDDPIERANAIQYEHEWANRLRASKIYGEWNVHVIEQVGHVTTNKAVIMNAVINGTYDTMSILRTGPGGPVGTGPRFLASLSDATWARMVLAAYNVMITQMSFPRDLVKKIEVTSHEGKRTSVNLHKFLYDIAAKSVTSGGKGKGKSRK
jgi:hypothetical protein